MWGNEFDRSCRIPLLNHRKASSTARDYITECEQPSGNFTQHGLRRPGTLYRYISLVLNNNNNNKYTEKKPETWKQSRYSNWNNFQHGSAFLFLIALLHHLRSVDISQEPCEDGRICDRLFHLLCIPWPESYRHLILLVSLKRQWDWPGKDRNRTKSPFLWKSLFCRFIRLDSFRLVKTMD